jgi:hypothetical protein
MTAKTCIAPSLYGNDIAIGFSRLLSQYKNNLGLPKFFGADSQFERNPQSQLSRIKKIHIMLPPDSWGPNVYQQYRKSDNYLVYVEHIVCPSHYQLLAILAPDAHKTIDRALPRLVIQAESFHALSRSDIEMLAWY